jgi:hypothetical protein
VRDFAAEHGLHLNEGCKALVALAVNELDRRYYPVVRQLADSMGGRNAITRACSHISTALQGARRATGLPLQLDPERSRFIVQTVRDFIAGKGLPVEGVCLWFLPEEAVAAAPQEAQEPFRQPVEQQKPQPAQRSGIERPRRVVRTPSPRQQPAEIAEDQEEASEGAQGVQAGQDSQPDPAR